MFWKDIIKDQEKTNLDLNSLKMLLNVLIQDKLNCNATERDFERSPRTPIYEQSLWNLVHWGDKIHINWCQNYLKNFGRKIWPWGIQHSSLSGSASSPSSPRSWCSETRIENLMTWKVKNLFIPICLYTYISIYLYIYISVSLSVCVM